MSICEWLASMEEFLLSDLSLGSIPLIGSIVESLCNFLMMLFHCIK